MTDHEYWKSEYDWIVSSPLHQKSTETVLSVLFDSGVQRQFSSVCLTLLSSDVATPSKSDSLQKTWQITPCPSSVSVVSHGSPQGTPVTQNDPSLPTCHVVFMADRQNSDVLSKHCGKLVFTEPGFASSSSIKLFEVNHPLTENTQSVSFSFTSSYILNTRITRGLFVTFDPSRDRVATVGRVVRVIPTTERRSIFLPTDVLLLVFEHLRSPLGYQSWRKDLLNATLVCREWTCALKLLLLDFRSQDNQECQVYPPEITSLANRLVARPSLGLGVRYLTVGYLEKHRMWNPYPELPPGMPLPMFLGNLIQQSELDRSHFAKAFLSILRVATNVQTLSLDSAIAFIVSPDDLVDALSGHSRLDTFKAKCTLTMAQLLSSIATSCPSLKCLSILKVLPPSIHNVPLPSPSFHLTELTLTDVPIKDDELVWLANTSGSTLQRLTLDQISDLTNAGLDAALTAVCTSLTYLYIDIDPELERVPGEEHALDMIIARMECLTDLNIVTKVASERMLERRAEAFARRSTTAVLPEVHLHLMISYYEARDRSGLKGAMARDWPGWRMDICTSRQRGKW